MKISWALGLVVVVAGLIGLIGGAEVSTPRHQAAVDQLAANLGVEAPPNLRGPEPADSKFGLGERYSNAQWEIRLDDAGEPLSYQFKRDVPFNRHTHRVWSKEQAIKRAREFLASQGPKLFVDVPSAEVQTNARYEHSEFAKGWWVSFLSAHNGIYGVPIWRVLVTRSGAIEKLIFLRAHPPLQTTAKLTATEARERLLASLKGWGKYELWEATLMLLPWPERGDRLRWEIVLKTSEPDGPYAECWVDAITGEVLIFAIHEDPLSGPVPSPPAPDATEEEPSRPLVDWPPTIAGTLAILVLVGVVLWSRRAKRAA